MAGKLMCRVGMVIRGEEAVTDVAKDGPMRDRGKAAGRTSGQDGMASKESMQHHGMYKGWHDEVLCCVKGESFRHRLLGRENAQV